MAPARRSVGLVLAGGGAKGAYTAGAVRYLAEAGFEPNLIAGTSIGALNGAAIAAAVDFRAGAEDIDRMWDELGRRKIVKLAAAEEALFTLASSAPILGPVVRALHHESSVLDPAPIEAAIREFIPTGALRSGTPLWVAVCKVSGVPLPAEHIVRLSTADAHWVHVNGIDEDEVLYETLLASAAVPIAFPSRRIEGTRFVDGGLRDNAPLGALQANGCTQAIVVHLGNGSVWDRNDFPGIQVIEIRPRAPIQERPGLWGWVSALLDFSPERIAELKQRGYQDARVCIEEIFGTLEPYRNSREESEQLRLQTMALVNDKSLAGDEAG